MVCTVTATDLTKLPDKIDTLPIRTFCHRCRFLMPFVKRLGVNRNNLLAYITMLNRIPNLFMCKLCYDRQMRLVHGFITLIHFLMTSKMQVLYIWNIRHETETLFHFKIKLFPFSKSELVRLKLNTKAMLSCLSYKVDQHILISA